MEWSASSHRQRWIFSPKDLKAARHAKHCSAGEEGADVEKLINEDAFFLQTVISGLLANFTKLEPVFRHPPDIPASAAILLHRFYLVAAFETHDAPLFSLAAAHLAMITHDAKIDPVDFLRTWASVDERALSLPKQALIDAEGSLARAIDFDLSVWGPYKALAAAQQLIEDAHAETVAGGDAKGGVVRSLVPPSLVEVLLHCEKTHDGSSAVATGGGGEVEMTPSTPSGVGARSVGSQRSLISSDALSEANLLLKRSLLHRDLPLTLAPHAIACAALRIGVGLPPSTAATGDGESGTKEGGEGEWDPDNLNLAEGCLRGMRLGTAAEKQSALQAVLVRCERAKAAATASGAM